MSLPRSSHSLFRGRKSRISEGINDLFRTKTKPRMELHNGKAIGYDCVADKPPRSVRPGHWHTAFDRQLEKSRRAVLVVSVSGRKTSPELSCTLTLADVIGGMPELGWNSAESLSGHETHRGINVRGLLAFSGMAQSSLQRRARKMQRFTDASLCIFQSS